MNKCRRCLTYQAAEMFRVRSDTGKRRQVCNSCENTSNKARYHGDPANKSANRERSWRSSLKKRYGMTPADYHSRLAAQDGRCALCSIPAEESRFGKLSVVHCHNTGEVRGLVCYLCNLALGYFRDNPRIFEKAHNYVSA